MSIHSNLTPSRGMPNLPLARDVSKLVNHVVGCGAGLVVRSFLAVHSFSDGRSEGRGFIYEEETGVHCFVV